MPEEWPRSLGRWSEKYFKKALDINRATVDKIRKKAVEVFLDEDKQLTGYRGGKEIPTNFNSIVGKKYLEACATRLEALLKREDADYRARSSVPEQCDAAFKAFVVVATHKKRTTPGSAVQKKAKAEPSKDNEDSSEDEAGEEDDDSSDEPVPVESPLPAESPAKKTAAKTVASSKTSATPKVAPAPKAPVSKTPASSKALAQKSTAHDESDAAKKPVIPKKQASKSAGEEVAAAVERESGEADSAAPVDTRQSSPAITEPSVAEDAKQCAPSKVVPEGPQSTIPAKRQRVDTPLSSTEFLARGLRIAPEATTGIPPNKIQRLSNAVMKAQAMIGADSVQDLVGCTDIGTRYIAPEALDTLTDTLFTVTKIWQKHVCHDASDGAVGFGEVEPAETGETTALSSSPVPGITEGASSDKAADTIEDIAMEVTHAQDAGEKSTYENLAEEKDAGEKSTEKLADEPAMEISKE